MVATRLLLHYLLPIYDFTFIWEYFTIIMTFTDFGFNFFIEFYDLNLLVLGKTRVFK